MKKNLYTSFYFIFILFVTLFIYWQGLEGPFLLDDFYNLKPLGENGGIINYYNFEQFVFGSTSSPLGRPVSFLSFVINDQAWPSDAYFFKYTNMLIHLLIGISLYVLLTQLKQSTPQIKLSTSVLLTCFFIWLIHPINLSTVFYIIQRMTELTTLFSLLALSCYIQAKNNSFNTLKLSLWLILFSLCSILAVFSKENGVNIILYVLVLEYTLLRNIEASKIWKYVQLFFILIPLLILIYYFISHSSNIARGYVTRDFTLIERLLTEPRVLFDSLAKLFLPTITGYSIYHDDFTLSRSIVEPITTLFSILGILALLFIAATARKKHPLISFAILWFFAGHILESSFISLEIYFEHRNYMPIIGPILALSFYLNTLTKKLFILPVIFLYLCFISYQNAMVWGNEEIFYRVNASEHPNSFRAQKNYINKVLAKYSPEKMKPAFEKLESIFPNKFSIKLQLLTVSCFEKNDSQKEIDNILSLKNFKIDFNDGNQFLSWATDVLETECVYANRKHLYQIGEFLLTHLDRKASHSIGIGKIHRVLSEAYVKDGNLNLAMKHLDAAYQERQEINILKTQARLLASAGLFDDAIATISKARKRDKILSKKKPSREKELNLLESQINLLKSNIQ